MLVCGDLKNLGFAKNMLEEEGIEVTTAENGQITDNAFYNYLEGIFDAVLIIEIELFCKGE